MKNSVLNSILLTTLLIVFTASSAFGYAGLSALGAAGDTTPTLSGGPAPTDSGEAEVVVTGASMFLVGAFYCHNNGLGDPFTVEREGLDLVYNCMTYLLGSTAGNIACIGEFYPTSISGLQLEHSNPLVNQNYMEFLEENLNGTNPGLPPDHPYDCSFSFVQITNDDPLTNGGSANYDMLMIGEQWECVEPNNYLHTRLEMINFVDAGGKIIIAGSSEIDPVAGQDMVFLPKDEINMHRQLIDHFPLPASDPGHPIARGINEGEWGIASEVTCYLRNYDTDYYAKIFSDEGGPDGYTTLLLGGTNYGLEPTSWGALKAELSE